MPNPDFERLNRLIRERGAHWTAGPNSHSHYFGEPEASGLLGVSATPAMEQLALEEAAAFDAELAGLKLALPPKLDWSAHKGRNWLTPVRAQGTCGTCVAFAVNACLESRLRIARKWTTAQTPDLSEAHLYFCGGSNSCSSGWWPPLAFKFAAKPGVGAEAAFPYASHQGVCRPVAPVVRAVGVRSTKVVNGRKLALQTGPVVGVMMIWDDFHAYQSGVYEPVSGSVRGRHAVCITGYDDAAQCWIGKNSWGAGWGQNGHFRIKYGVCGLDTAYPFFYSGVQAV